MVRNQVRKRLQYLRLLSKGRVYLLFQTINISLYFILLVSGVSYYCWSVLAMIVQCAVCVLTLSVGDDSLGGCELQFSPSSHLTMNCLAPSPSPSPSVCRCECSCRLKSPATTSSAEPSKPAGSLLTFVRNIQQSWFAVDKNRNSLNSSLKGSQF